MNEQAQQKNAGRKKSRSTHTKGNEKVLKIFNSRDLLFN